MHTVKKFLLPRIFALLTLAASGGALAQAAGSVVFTAGAATIERGGTATAMQRGAEVRVGDVLVTGANGHAQLRMSDNAFLAMRPGTRLTLERHNFNTTADGALYSLAGGVIRLFTGLIAQKDRASVRMRTPISTVGVRGSGNILAHSDDLGSINHTLTGAHEMSAKDARGMERSLISRPGQTIQVLPGALPKFIPTPPFLFSAASGPLIASAGEEAAFLESLLSLAEELDPNDELSDEELELLLGLLLELLDDLSEKQLPAERPATGLARYSIANTGAGGGRIGVVLQPSQTFGDDFLFGFDGELLAMDRVMYNTFISGSGAAPAGFTPVTISNAFIEFDGGEAHEVFRNDEGSISQGRWQGGQVIISDNDNPNAAPIVHELGNTSIAWQVFSATPAGIVASFTGASQYQLAAATAPTDAFGNVGILNQMQLNLNFTNRQASGSFALNINNQNLSASFSNAAFGTGGLVALNLSPTQLQCTGSGCSSAGYAGAFNANLAGQSGAWLAANYRISPVRPSGSGLTDHIAGFAALHATSLPQVGIVLPITGTRSLSLTSFSSQSGGPGSVSVTQSSGTLNANFSSRTVDMSMNLGLVRSNDSGTLSLSASAMPLLGVGFVAFTDEVDARLASSVARLNVTCSGTACTGGALRGRFDGYFTDAQGTGAAGSVFLNNDSATNPFNLSGQTIFGVAASPGVARSSNLAQVVVNRSQATTTRIVSEGANLFGRGRIAQP